MKTALLEEEEIDNPLPHQLRENRGRYSLGRAVRRMAERGGGSVSPDGLEGECSAELARRLNREPRGLLVPLDAPIQTRTLDTTTGVGAIFTVPGRPFIDLLRAKALVTRLGAEVIPDLPRGRFGIPRVSTATIPVWTAEAVAAPATNMAVTDQMLLAPRSIGAYSDYSQKMLRLWPGLEAELSSSLTRALAVELDRVAINGTGLGSEPLGLAQGLAAITQTCGLP